MNRNGGDLVALFALADTHLSLSVNKPMDIFGNRWENHTEKLSAGWRSCVTDRDTVVIPGDISWAMTLRDAGADLHFLDDLPGKKLLLRGNHDFWWSSALKMNAFFEQEQIRSVSFLQNSGCYAEGYILAGSRGWYQDEKNAPRDADYRKIVLREAMRLDMSIKSGIAAWGGEASERPEILCFLHFPPVFREYVCREILDVLHVWGITRCFYGHIHGVYNMPPLQRYEDVSFIPVSADYLNFIPLRIPEAEQNHE